MGCFAKLGQLLRALASYSPLRLARWVFFGNDGGGKGRSKHAKLLQRTVAMASPFLLEEFEPRLLLSTVSLSENFDGSGYTTNSSRYNVAIVSKLSTDTHNTATTDGYLPQSDGSDIVVSLSCAAGDTGGSCGVASGDYNLQFDLYAMDNMNADGSIGNGAYSVTAVNVDTGATIDTVAGNLSDLTPTAGNVNGTYTGDTSSYTAGTWPTYDSSGSCGCGCCSVIAPYVEDPDYDMTIPLHLENASQINIHINVTGMNGTYAAGQFGVDNIILSGDLTVTQASTRPTSDTGALVTWQSDPYAVAYVISASTDGTHFSPVGHAGPNDSGMLVTGLTAGGFYTFRMTAFTADGGNDAEATTGTITLSGGAIGAYTVSSSDGLTLHRDAGAAFGITSSMDILNDTVVAGSPEEAVLLSLDPNGTIQPCGTSDSYTPLSGALQYFDDYVTADAGDLGAAGTDVGSAIGVAEGWQPGDDFSTFGFHDDFMLITATKVADFGVSVQANDPFATRDPSDPATFLITRIGDDSASAVINFHIDLGSGFGAADFVVTGDSGSVTYNPSTGYGSYDFGAGVASANVVITPGDTTGDFTGGMTLYLDAPSTGDPDYAVAAYPNVYPNGLNGVTTPTYSPPPATLTADAVIGAAPPADLVVNRVAGASEPANPNVAGFYSFQWDFALNKAVTSYPIILLQTIDIKEDIKILPDTTTHYTSDQSYTEVVGIFRPGETQSDLYGDKMTLAALEEYNQGLGTGSTQPIAIPSESVLDTQLTSDYNDTQDTGAYSTALLQDYRQPSIDTWDYSGMAITITNPDLTMTTQTTSGTVTTTGTLLAYQATEGLLESIVSGFTGGDNWTADPTSGNWDNITRAPTSFGTVLGAGAWAHTVDSSAFQSSYSSLLLYTEATPKVSTATWTSNGATTVTFN